MTSFRNFSDDMLIKHEFESFRIYLLHHPLTWVNLTQLKTYYSQTP